MHKSIAVAASVAILALAGCSSSGEAEEPQYSPAPLTLPSRTPQPSVTLSETPEAPSPSEGPTTPEAPSGSPTGTPTPAPTPNVTNEDEDQRVIDAMPDAPPAAALRTTPKWPQSPAKKYTSVGELLKDSQYVAAITPRDEKVTQESNPPQTTRTVSTDLSMKGNLDGDLKITEPGDGREPYSLEPGKNYVVFLKKGAGDTYVVTGLTQGIFRIDGSSATPVDPTMTQLPQNTSAATLLGLQQ